MYIHLLLIVVSIFIPIGLLLVVRSFTMQILGDLRVLRILHYVVLAGLGMALFFKDYQLFIRFLQGDRALLFPLFAIALTYAAVFAIVTNNIEDLEADKLSNPRRPLVTGRVNRFSYLMTGLGCLVYALILSLLAQIEMFLAILFISLGYYVYSCRPFRLKRIPFLAKLFIGINSLVVTIGGYVLAGGQLKDFPLLWIIFILVPLTLSANFVDLKDTEGDGSTGVRTLPVMWGEKKARFFIAFFTVCTYIMAGIILDITWLYPLNALMAIIHCYFLYRKPYDEKPVFLIYITALVSLNIILLFHKQLSSS